MSVDFEKSPKNWIEYKSKKRIIKYSCVFYVCFGKIIHQKEIKKIAHSYGNNKSKPSGIYDLGTSNPTSFQEVAELVAKKYDGTIEYIPFPEHLEGKYQTYTCAKKEWDHEFITVKEYLQV